MRRIMSGLLLVTLALTGCSDEVDPYEPDPLVDIDNQFDIDVLWSTQIGDGTSDKTVKLEPIYSQGKIFVADNSGEIAAIDPKNGDVLWKVGLEEEIGGGPDVSNEQLVVGTQKGQLVTMSAKDGSEIWRKQVSSEIISSPAIGDGYVVVNSVDGKITGFDAETGEQKWFYEQSIPPLTLRGTSAPVIAGGGAIAGFANGKLAVFLLEDGRMAWEKTITAPVGRSEIQRLVDIDVRPQVSGSSIYVASFNGNLAHVDARNGETVWQRELSTFQEISLSELLLLVTHENSFVSAVDRSNGVALWTQKSLHRRMLSAPVAVGNQIVVADFEGYLHWLSRKDGTVQSRRQIDSSGISAKPLVIDDTVFLLSNSGKLYAVKKG